MAISKHKAGAHRAKDVPFELLMFEEVVEQTTCSMFVSPLSRQLHYCCTAGGLGKPSVVLGADRYSWYAAARRAPLDK